MDNRLNFTLQEYAERLRKVRQQMAQQEIDLLIVNDPSNMSWLSGYDGCSYYTPQAVVVAMTGEPLWFGRQMDTAGARRTVYMTSENIVGYPDHYVMNPPLHAMAYLAQVVLPERGLQHGTIGVEMDSFYFTHSAFNALNDHLPKAAFCDATGLVNRLRARKSEQEISYMRIASRICERAHQAALEMIEPGLPKNRLAAEIYRVSVNGLDDHAGDYPSIIPIINSGADASAPHLTWDETPFKNDEGCFIELAGCHKRYHSVLSRTVYLGEPPKAFLQAEEALNAGLEAGLAVAKPGSTGADVAHALNSALAKFGFDRGGARCGYPIGLSYPPDWGEHGMSLRSGDETVLEQGMTFHFMPGLWLDNWGIETTESILITESGVETLCDYPRKLFSKG